MFKSQKLLVFDICRKFTEIGTGTKIAKTYCASADYIEYFYIKDKSIQSKMKDEFMSQDDKHMSILGPLVSASGPISKFRKLIAHLQTICNNSITKLKS